MFNLKDMPQTAMMNFSDTVNATIHQVEAGYQERLTQIRQYDFGAVFEHYLQD